MAKQDLTTQQVIKRLASKFPSPQYGFLTQIRNGTGGLYGGTADAMAMSVWPSRGLELYGFEVKVSRTDWLKEWKKPEKAENFAGYMHYWYLVVGNEDIVKAEELPATWGLIVPSGNGLKITKQAPKNEHIVPIDYVLMGGIFRNVAEQCVAKETLQDRFDEQFERGKEWQQRYVKEAERELGELKTALADFHKASGIQISQWGNNGDLGKAVRAVLDGKDKKYQEKISKMLERAQNLVKFLEGEAGISDWDL